LTFKVKGYTDFNSVILFNILFAYFPMHCMLTIEIQLTTNQWHQEDNKKKQIKENKYRKVFK